MRQLKRNTKLIKSTSWLLLWIMIAELLYPIKSFSLTSGPSQPEVQSFEPVGTTDMVDMFTGDFVYNVPLLDIDGYPVNISYHSGGDIEQEASWVGLGWNINPGVISRAMRGLPDDFDGEVIEKTLNLKEEKNIRVGVGAGIEFAGVGDPILSLSISGDAYLNVSNYRGVSVDFTSSIGASASLGGIGVNAGLNFGVGSQNGADIDYSYGFQFGSAQSLGRDVSANVGYNITSGYSTRSGLKDKTHGFSIGVNVGGARALSYSSSNTTPISLKNYVPVISNESNMLTLRARLKAGGTIGWSLIYGNAMGQISKVNYKQEGNRKGFGFLYLENATDADILDFTRDSDGLFNETMNYLPFSSMTYDLLTVSGQGTGGSYRPFRNNYGSVYDPTNKSETSDYSFEIEAGLGDIFTLGVDISLSETEMVSGPWEDYKREWKKTDRGTIGENYYFKQAGELTATYGNYETLGEKNVLTVNDGKNLPQLNPTTYKKRTPRGNLLYFYNALDASKYGVASTRFIENYSSADGFATNPNGGKLNVERLGGNRKQSHISEVVQVLTDGRRYNYGIAAMNNYQKEVTFATNDNDSDGDGLITYTSTDNSTSNGNGRDNFYSSTKTPAYAHSYLLTSVLSADYIDVKGDGISEDDFGTYTKFNYTLKNSNYKWKTPYGNNTGQFNPGFKSDTRDNKASLVEGSREQWMLHSIESKNYLAEFFTSSRQDGRGMDMSNDLSYKLDSIKLYNKNERLKLGNNAVPIKTVIFSYNYELCKGIPNSSNTAQGKLTLKGIYFKYGNSEKSMISPYQFTYSNNYNYNFANKDRWGVYKPNNTSLPNSDFPYTMQQNDTLQNQYAAAWSLTNIKLPSGGEINVDYESDDYAYVQDREAMNMFILAGVGNSNSFYAGNQLYFNTSSPNNYLFFNRNKAKEFQNKSPKENYLKNDKLVYFNCDVELVYGKKDHVRGYAEVEEIGYCNDSVHGYLKIKDVGIAGSDAVANSITYTALNFGRYYVPSTLFPGDDPDVSSVTNVLGGLLYSFNELLNFRKNPIKRMIQEGRAKNLKLNSSFLRLNTPGLAKKGGGQRVKQLTFKDNWDKIAGASNSLSIYGKKYDYTTKDNQNNTISSGVASWEPNIGGDENPHKFPDNYIAQKASKFPPNDPIGLYQELPIGESLYPPAVVGYSKVTVTSINKELGASSQAIDIQEFYTAKDFPVVCKSQPIDKPTPVKVNTLRLQTVEVEAKQGHVLILNDMHGKLKRKEYRIAKAGSPYSDLINYTQYNYFKSGKELENNVPVLEYDEVENKMKKRTRRMAIESDVTMDSRRKIESTKTLMIVANLNISQVALIPIPIPFGFPFSPKKRSEIYIATVSKMVQQYGILQSIESFNEGATTTVENIAFDPVTGQALITSVNNEYNDKEYTMNYPAYWGYQSMGGSYENVMAEIPLVTANIEDYKIELPSSYSNILKDGDELLLTYTDGSGAEKSNNLWVKYEPIKQKNLKKLECYYCNPDEDADTNFIGSTIYYGFPYDELDEYSLVYNCSGEGFIDVPSGNCNKFKITLLPRYKYSFPASGILAKAYLKVIRSGKKNQLNETIQTYMGMDLPISGDNTVINQYKSTISISAKEYSSTNYAIPTRFSEQYNPSYYDSVNIFVNGTKGLMKVTKEYAYIKNRNYVGNNRFDGLFNAVPFWKVGGLPCEDTIMYCKLNNVYFQYLSKKPGIGNLGYNFMLPSPASDNNWVVANQITKYSPWGYELEQKNAIGNFSAALYGYNNLLPTAVGQNTRQFDLFFESFEDFDLLQTKNAEHYFWGSLFKSYFNVISFGSTNYNIFNLVGLSGLEITKQASHTGSSSLATSSAFNLVMQVAEESALNNSKELLPFTLRGGGKYLLSYWIKPKSVTPLTLDYSIPTEYIKKSPIIEGWQLIEREVNIPSSSTTYTIILPANMYIDDIRMHPIKANMKSFVYNPINQKLMATLDENNYASFYEYDQEGNLLRTKKETEKGIMTITESRSAHPKK